MSYVDLAGLAIAAPLAIDVTVRRATRLRGEQAVNVPAGHTRFLVEADVTALIRGASGLPQRINYLVDLPNDAANRPPRFRDGRFLLLAAPVAGRAGFVQLVAPEAHIPWTPEADRRLRAILTELVAPDAPPRITGIGNAFHVPGSLPGESETQIFLVTADNRPVSLNILRRPGEDPRWAVALGEMVDDAAAPPARETLLWYRLACGLPRTLPASVTARLEGGEAAPVRADYALVLAALGPCRAGVAR